MGTERSVCDLLLWAILEITISSGGAEFSPRINPALKTECINGLATVKSPKDICKFSEILISSSRYLMLRIIGARE